MDKRSYEALSVAIDGEVIEAMYSLGCTFLYGNSFLDVDDVKGAELL